MRSLLSVRWSATVLFALAANAAAAPRLDYTATIDSQTETLTLQLCSANATTLDLRGAAQFATRIETPTGDVRVERRVRVVLPDHGCATITTDLRAAGQADRYRLGRERGLYYRLAAEQWLWRPAHIAADSTLRFRLPKAWSASVPWAENRGVYRLGATPSGWPALTVFGRFEVERVPVPGGELRLAMLPLSDTATRAAMHEWLVDSARRYFAAGGLPVANPQVLVVPLPGVKSAVPWGQIQRGGAPAVHLYVGAEAGGDAWREDWTLAHELAHLQHPYLGERGRWLAEGLASYHQNVWRARAGDLTAQAAWRRLLAGFARGRAVAPGEQLASIERGWSNTMRVYWSGAAYWFESDLAMRAVGSSLDEVLQRYRRAGLALERRVEPADFIAALDAIEPRGGLRRRYDQYLALSSFPPLLEARAALILGAPELWPDEMPDHPWLKAIFAPQKEHAL